MAGGVPPPSGDLPTPSPEYLAESDQEMIKAVLWVSTAIPLAAVILRCYTRLYLRRVFGIDDGVIIVAIMVLIAYAGIITAAVHYGLGRHIEFVLQNPDNGLKVAFLGQVSQPFVIMSCALGKTSFALTLMRIAAQRWIHYVLWFIIISMNAVHLIISVSLFKRCEDPRHLWNPAIPSKCWSAESFLGLSLFIGSYSAATDFALAFLPWAMLWGLNMKKKEKFGVALAMSLGVLFVKPVFLCNVFLVMLTSDPSAGATAIVKSTKLAANGNDQDATWALGPLLLWAGAENGLIISAASIPTLRPLLARIFPSSSAKRSNDSYPLKNISNNLNVFRPKASQGQWSAIVETAQGYQPEHQSDDRSESSILKQHTDGIDSAPGAGGRSVVDRQSMGTAGIQKTTTTQVDISYLDGIRSAGPSKDARHTNAV